MATATANASVPLNSSSTSATPAVVSSVLDPLCTDIPTDFWTRYGCSLVQVLACALCCHLAVTACRLRMQRTSFSLPLTLAPALTFALLAVSPEWAVVRSWPGSLGSAGVPETSIRWWLTAAAFLAGWLSNVALASHAFTHIPPDRLMFTQR